VTVDDIRTEVLDSSSRMALPPDSAWRVASIALTPQRLLRETRNGRWQGRIIVGSIGRHVAGIVSIHQWHGREFPSPIFDPAEVAGEIFPKLGQPADEYLMIGNVSDQVAGFSTVKGLDSATEGRLGRALFNRAFKVASDEGLVPAALYVREEQAQALLSAASGDRMQGRVIDHFGKLHLSDKPYPELLKQSHRSVVRRDLRRLHDLGLRGTVCAAAEVATEASPLVADIKRRHGVSDHPKLIAYRLLQWSRDETGKRIAFCVRDPSGELLAATFGCHHGDLLELYEIGLSPESPLRHLAYVESMIYAPIRYAEAAGCVEVHLGLGTPQPKGLRGASFSPVLAIGPGRSS
jgi:hypothetical protein